jgi:hypothetical protein
MRDDASSLVVSFVGLADEVSTARQCLVQIELHRADADWWLEAAVDGTARPRRWLDAAGAAWWQGSIPGPGPCPGPGGGGAEEAAAITNGDRTPALGPRLPSWRRRCRAEMRDRLAATRAEVGCQRAELEARRARTEEMRAWLAELRGEVPATAPTPIRRDEYEAMAAD